jgi:hypothetical protein
MDAYIEAGSPQLDAWQAWDPPQAAAILADCPVPWFVAGGWSVDLALGRRTRDHEDLEIVISRTDFDVYRPYLQSLGPFDLYDTGSGRAARLAGGQAPNPDNHQIWLCDREADVWRMDTFLDPGDEQTWICYRDAAIRLPRSQAVRRTVDGIAYLAPAITLFLKAKHHRDKDEADFATALPTLDTDETAWLARTIEYAHPGHHWLERIREQ